MSDNDTINEKLLKTYPVPVSIESTKKILYQMQNCICKINNSNGKGTGFFCYITNKKNQNEKCPVLITNNHVIDEQIIKESKSIKLSLNDDDTKTIDIKLKNRKIYTNIEYDTTIIEIKPVNDKLNENNFLELDMRIFEDNINLINEDIYIIQYPKYNFSLQKAAVSYGKIIEIKENEVKIGDEYNIFHICSTEEGSSGSPILNLSYNKIIGIHSGRHKKYNANLGISLQYPVKEYLNDINLISNKKHDSQSDFRIYYDIIKENGGFNDSVYYKVKEKETNEKKVILLFKKLAVSYLLYDHLVKNYENMKIVEGKNLENKNIVKYYEYFDNEKEFAIVMELFDYDLYRYIMKRERTFDVEEIYDILCQLNNTLKIMSKNKIYHGNINLYNILIKENKNKKLIFKLSNNYDGEFEISKFGDYVGILHHVFFISPEKIKGKEFCEKSDLWSLGILIYFLYFKEYPYKGKSLTRLILNIINFGHECLKKTQNENLNDLIQRLLTKDINKRITWEQYFSHPFFNKN